MWSVVRCQLPECKACLSFDGSTELAESGERPTPGQAKPAFVRVRNRYPEFAQSKLCTP
ncbi:hypothetical protein QUF80_02795 [Desulfococcaceae bacterium HSG8]|nr:hypothetical protein [Desulfococcaceae bacterium HSG8]